MKVLNRILVILRPKPPYAKWANGVDQEEPRYVLEEHRTEGSAYLLPEIQNETDKARILRRYYQAMFDHELAAWMQDETCWPAHRDWKTFQEWFEVEWRSIVIDLVPGMLELVKM